MPNCPYCTKMLQVISKIGPQSNIEEEENIRDWKNRYLVYSCLVGDCRGMYFTQDLHPIKFSGKTRLETLIILALEEKNHD